MLLPYFALLLLLLSLTPLMGQSVPTGTITADPLVITTRHTQNVIAEQVTPLTIMTNNGPQSCTLTPISNVAIVDVEPKSGTTPFVANVVTTGAFQAFGDYSARIRVQCSNTFAPREVTVIVNVTERNELRPSVPELRFDVERGFRRVITKSFIVRSSGVATAVNNVFTDPLPILSFNLLGARPTPYTVHVRLDNRPPGSNLFINEGGFAQVTMTPFNGNPYFFPIQVGSWQFGIGKSTVESMQFFHQQGGPLPEARILELLADRNRIPYTLSVTYERVLGLPSTPDWLELNRREGRMSDAVLVRPKVESLPQGTHRARILVRLPEDTNGSFEIPVSLTIGQDLFPVVETRRINFSTVPETPGFLQNTLTRTITIDNPRGPVQFALKVDTGRQNPWLKAEPTVGTTPATVTLTVDPTDLAPSAYEGSIEVLGPGMDNVPYKIPVRLNVTDQGLIKSDTDSIHIIHPLGRTGDYRRLVLFSEPPQTIGPSWVATKIVANPATNSDWVKISSDNGRTPWALGVTVDPTGLPAGDYLSTVYFRFNDDYDTFFVLPVRLTVTNRQPLLVDKPALTFFKEPGGANPAAQEVTIATNGDPYDLRIATPQGTNGNWLVVNKVIGATPLRFSVQPNAANIFGPGRYRQNIIITGIPQPGYPTPDPITIPAEFVIGYRIQTNTESLSFEASTTGATPTPRTITLGSAIAATVFEASATTMSGGNWLSVQQATPGIVTASVNQAGLAPGRYNGMIRVTGTNVVETSIPVTLVVTQGAARTDLGVANGASFATGAVAPGTLITLFGDRIGPATLANAQVTNGRVTTNLADTQVLFDDVAAPMIYASRTQTSVLVPFEVSGKATARLRVLLNGVTYYDQPVTIASSSPGIFTATQNGSGSAAIINQDGSNNNSTPALAGSIVSVFVTGLGQTNPASQTGEIVTGARPQALEVTAFINGNPATVTYAGAAPGLAAGIGQVNVRIPTNSASGNLPITIVSGGNRSQTTATVRVQ
jgi:uncharacterized protein (TIGR03437 family)